MVKKGSSKKTCFVIGPIGKENSDIRKDADRLFKFIISPTVEKLGYETPVRADHIPNPGTITSQIIENLRGCCITPPTPLKNNRKYFTGVPTIH